ncbi:MAG: NAD(P)-dependent oxidoreductase [Lewinella sp.]|nr:NAD(P)-dependent oxidoreductase [Lewinella sp.]
MTKRIFFTGGSGKAGKHVIAYLLDRGYRVMNVDLVSLEHPGVETRAVSSLFIWCIPISVQLLEVIPQTC